MKKKKMMVVGILILLLICVFGFQTHASESVEVSNLTELVNALNNASDGDVIVITDKITINESITLGDSSKRVTLKKTNDGRISITFSASHFVTFQNIDFDGQEIESTYALIEVYCESAFENCTFKDCSGYSGGAIFVQGFPVTIKGCTFTNCCAENGGAVYLNASGEVEISDCTFTNNSVYSKEYESVCFGGAIQIGSVDATVSMIGCTLTGNSSEDYGGAISNITNLTIDSCLIYNNTASNGNDIYTNGTLNLTDTENALFALFDPLNLIPEGWKDEDETDIFLTLPASLTGEYNLQLVFTEEQEDENDEQIEDDQEDLEENQEENQDDQEESIPESSQEDSQNSVVYNYYTYESGTESESNDAGTTETESGTTDASTDDTTSSDASTTSTTSTDETTASEDETVDSEQSDSSTESNDGVIVNNYITLNFSDSSTSSTSSQTGLEDGEEQIEDAEIVPTASEDSTSQEQEQVIESESETDMQGIITDVLLILILVVLVFNNVKKKF